MTIRCGNCELFPLSHCRFAELSRGLRFSPGVTACNRGRHRAGVNYVSAVQATLRDQVATIYNRVGTVKNGERVECWSMRSAFACAHGERVEGWIEQRYLVDQQPMTACRS